MFTKRGKKMCFKPKGGGCLKTPGGKICRVGKQWNVTLETSIVTKKEREDLRNVEEETQKKIDGTNLINGCESKQITSQIKRGNHKQLADLENKWKQK